MNATAERSTVEVLKAARERISDPERWTRGRLSDTCQFIDEGFEIEAPIVREGTCWCVMGALVCESCSEEDFNAAADAWVRASSRISGTGGGAGFNDSHGHDEVLAVFPLAIELAEAEEQS